MSTKSEISDQNCVHLYCKLLPLQRRPAVPGMPLSGSRRQKSGEGAKYTRSRVAGGFTWGSRGRRAVREPTRVRRT